MVGVTAGAVDPTLRELARLRRADGSLVQPDACDLALTAGWGYAGRDGITMLAQRADQCMAIQDRRLPGHQKMAQLPLPERPMDRFWNCFT